MKTENFVTWLLLGYIAWKLHEGLQVAPGTCGGQTTVPTSNLANAIQAGWANEMAAGTLGCYQCASLTGCNCAAS